MTAAPAPMPRAVGRGVPVPTDTVLTLEQLGAPAFAVVVYGDPLPQGSKGPGGSYRKRTKSGQMVVVPRLVDTSDKATKSRAAGGLTRWRTAVAAAAIAAMPPTWEALDGPLVADVIVSVSRLASTPKTLRALPYTTEDLDKLARACNDALSTVCAKVNPRGVGVMLNDNRVVSYRRLDKVFVGDEHDSDSLRRPGAVLRLWRYPTHLYGRGRTS